jgi:hypothetical protein
MNTRTRSCRLWLAIGCVVTLATTASPALSSTPGQPRVLALNVRGVGTLDPSFPSRWFYTAEVYSLVTGERVGTALHEFALAASAETGVVEHLVTFRRPEGEIASHALESLVPDPLHPGHALVGVHPERGTILPEHGTGIYAGRTGNLRMSGWHDGRAAPASLGLDDFYVIELDPR